MWFHVQIIAQVLTVMFAPFLLVAALSRIFLPKARVWHLGLLAVLIILFVDSHVHFFQNPIRIDWIVAQSLDTGSLAQFGPVAQGIFVALSFSAMMFGSILIPLLFARGGIAIIDKLRKWTGPNKALEATSESAPSAASLSTQD